jgi:hypothetical protein
MVRLIIHEEVLEAEEVVTMEQVYQNVYNVRRCDQACCIQRH